jgi:hypothetical protein
VDSGTRGRSPPWGCLGSDDRRRPLQYALNYATDCRAYEDFVAFVAEHGSSWEFGTTWNPGFYLLDDMHQALVQPGNDQGKLGNDAVALGPVCLRGVGTLTAGRSPGTAMSRCLPPRQRDRRRRSRGQKSSSNPPHNIATSWLGTSQRPNSCSSRMVGPREGRASLGESESPLEPPLDFADVRTSRKRGTALPALAAGHRWGQHGESPGTHDQMRNRR